MFNVYYTSTDIAKITGLAVTTINERIRELGIYPDEKIGKSRIFYQDKTNCIIANMRYGRKDRFLIFESKMNYV